jgi:hypothetical protein
MYTEICREHRVYNRCVNRNKRGAQSIQQICIQKYAESTEYATDMYTGICWEHEVYNRYVYRKCRGRRVRHIYVYRKI